MLLNSVVALALLATTVSAQNNSTYIDPNTVTPQLRASWCIGEGNGCSNLCGGPASTANNTCQADKLTWTCICNNGSSPDLQAYTNTMPYYICTTSFDQCIAAHPDDALGQTNCKTNILSQCGTLNSSDVQVASTSSSSSSSSAPSPTAASTSTSAAPSTTAKPNAGTALKLGKDYGTGIVAAGLIGAFGLLL